MTVDVRLFATFQEISSRSRLKVDAPDVLHLLHELVDRYQALEPEIFEDREKPRLRERVKIMVNGRNIEFLDGLKTGLKDGDRVAVFPTIAGG